MSAAAPSRLPRSASPVLSKRPARPARTAPSLQQATDVVGGLAPGDADAADRIRVTEVQRARLLSAAGKVACDSGIATLTVGQIVSQAGVSRRTFYEIFSDSAECSLDVLRDALERAQQRVIPAWRSQGNWRERTRRALIELLCLFDEDPVLARLLLVESLGAGHSVIEERARVLNWIVDGLDTCARRETGPSGETTRLAVEGAVGGVLSILQARVTESPSEPLIDLAGPLMGVLTMPHHGPVAARREASRPVQFPAGRTRSGSKPTIGGDPIKEAGMRLTYRTMRVLGAVDGHPGCSNKQVGGLAEMTDPGQISKLLSRLERAGLIINSGGGRGRGEPNAWSLTGAGREVANKIRVGSAHSEPVTRGTP